MNMSETRKDDVQPLPIATGMKPTWELVIDDFKKRDSFGRRKYGTPLTPSNGRDSLEDAYDEALDLVAYLRNLIEERRLQKGAAYKFVNEYLHSPEMSGKNLAQSVLIDVREALKGAGL